MKYIKYIIIIFILSAIIVLFSYKHYSNNSIKNNDIIENDSKAPNILINDETNNNDLVTSDDDVSTDIVDTPKDETNNKKETPSTDLKKTKENKNNNNNVNNSNSPSTATDDKPTNNNVDNSSNNNDSNNNQSDNNQNNSNENTNNDNNNQPAVNNDDDSVDPNGLDYPIHKGRIDCSGFEDCKRISYPIQFKYIKSITNTYYLEVIAKNDKTLGYFIQYMFKDGNYGSYEECQAKGNEIKQTLSDRVTGFTCDESGTLKIKTDY